MRLNLNDPKTQYIMVLASSGITIVFGFVLSILMTRSMEVEQYGYYKAFTNSLTLLVTLASLGFSLTLSKKFAVCEKTEQKRRLTGAAYVINFAIALLVVAVAAVVYGIGKWAGVEIPSYLLLAAALVWVMLLQRFYIFRFQGENNMVLYALLSMLPTVLLTAMAALCFAFCVPVSGWAAITGYLMSYILPMGVFFFREIPQLSYVKEDIGSLWKENWRYGFQLHLGSLASVASANLLNLLVAPISGLGEYAFFTMGLTLATPVRQVPMVMGTISFKKNVKQPKLPKGQILLTVAITAAALVVYTLFLKYIMVLLIGQEYLESIGYAVVLVYYDALMGMGDFFNRFIIAKGYGKMVRNNSVIVGVVLVVSAAVLVPLWTVKGVILAEMISAVIYVLLMIMCYRKIVWKGIEEKQSENQENPEKGESL